MGFRSFLTTCFICLLTAGSEVDASTVPLEKRPGLKRFSPDTKLHFASEWDIRNVHVGDNVLVSARFLQQQGGEIPYITGGSRSRRIKISFSQPFSGATLEQEFALNFDKDKGFVTDIAVQYTLDDAYMAIDSVYQQVLSGAIAKYGDPVKMDKINALSNTSGKDVRLSSFVRALEENQGFSEAVIAFFKQQVVTRTSRFSPSENGAASLLSGFRECLLWEREAFSELITLCRFKDSSGNQKGQGVELHLRSFTVEQHIQSYLKDAENPPVADILIVAHRPGDNMSWLLF